jgi:hypothetical protein
MGNCWMRLADWLFPNPWDGMVIQTIGYQHKIYNIDLGLQSGSWQRIEPLLVQPVAPPPLPKAEETDPLLARKPVVESIISINIPVKTPIARPQTKPPLPPSPLRLPASPRMPRSALPPPPISLLTLTKQKYTPTSSPNCPPQPAPPLLQ